MKNVIIWLGSIFAAIVGGYIIAYFGVLSIAIILFLIAVTLIVWQTFRDPFWGFLAIIFFLPFERVPTYQVSGIDIKINVALGFLTLVAWILALLFNGKKWKVQPSALSIPIGLFIIALLMSLTNALNFSRGMQVLFFTLFTIALSFMTVNMVSDKSRLEKVVTVLFMSGLLVSFFSLFQFAGDVVGLPRSLTLLKEGYDSKTFGFPRVQAFSMEPLYLANYLLIPLFLALSYFLSKVGKTSSSTVKILNNPWLLFFFISLMILVLVLTVSRGGYLGFGIGLFYMMIVLFKKFFTIKNILISLLVITIVSYGVTFALSKGDYRATNEFVGHVMIKDYKVGESVNGRLAAFKQAYRAYDRNPVFGIGIGNYGPYVKNYPTNKPKTGWDIVNNQFIELLAETGIFGVATYFLLLITLFIRSLIAITKAKDQFIKATLIGLTAAFIGIFVQYNFFSTLYIIHIWILIGLLIGVQSLVFSKRSDVKETKSS